MKKLKKGLRMVALFLSGLIFLQSCSAYKTPVTLQQAAQEEKAVKIFTVDDDTFKYKYIVYEDGQFYGVKDNPGEDVKFPINTDEVTDVMMEKDKGVFLKWGIIGVIVVFLISIPIFLLTY
ncbi:hypothetical protein [Lentiprolixibacter aurantiacus]|uniref:Uncharacterized protein n=1 Tax=Lentiprolixibacter aurantiacus TaxID=2993939 RepID=A0AAE3MKF9_9FLAO|nr:hypothetical protein [Lentiprolixibacter aurantiacus]MCX2719074.1 hypothetical protein [Lentiprolixibacter aurantiacus]